MKPLVFRLLLFEKYTTLSLLCFIVPLVRKCSQKVITFETIFSFVRSLSPLSALEKLKAKAAEADKAAAALELVAKAAEVKAEAAKAEAADKAAAALELLSSGKIDKASKAAEAAKAAKAEAAKADKAAAEAKAKAEAAKKASEGTKAEADKAEKAAKDKQVTKNDLRQAAVALSSALAVDYTQKQLIDSGATSCGQYGYWKRFILILRLLGFAVVIVPLSEAATIEKYNNSLKAAIEKAAEAADKAEKAAAK